jgi:urea transporter
MIRRLLNFFLVVLLAPALFAFIYKGVLFLASVFTLDATKWFLLGAALSLVAYFLLPRNHIAFVSGLLHELEHAALAFAFTFKLPTRMEIDTQKGSKVFVPKGGGCLTVLAPYYLPLLTIPFLLLKALASLAFSLLGAPFPPFLAAALDLLIGATLMFHLLCTGGEFRLFQTDIKETGLIASFIGVFFLNFVFVVLSVVVVTESYAEFVAYIKASLATALEAYKAVFEFLKTRVLPILQGLAETVKGLFSSKSTPAPAP